MRICEIYYSLQGEGMLMGLPTVFIRAVGCNLDCSWCDTPYAREGGEEMLVEDIAKKVEAFGVDTVCITGGEPLIQDDTYQLIDALLDRGFCIQLETNGSISLDRLPCYEELMISMDIKTPSSGMKGSTVMKNLEMLSPFDQLKFVVAGKEDMNFVEETLSSNEIKCPVIVTAVGGVELLEVAEWVLSKRLQIRVMPQLHKIIWGEQRGI
jgi:7-carboxy-7-deazaguanine synthase